MSEGSPSEKPALTTYLESSALVAAVLEGDAVMVRALSSPSRLVASALTFTETLRALVRARSAGRIDSGRAAAMQFHLTAHADRCILVGVTADVLSRAGQPFPVEPVRTLDAIHLATIEHLGAAPHTIRVLTRDARVAANARALGYLVG